MAANGKLHELDWREQLLRAVAYRMTEIHALYEPDMARKHVRDVMLHGTNSAHFKVVVEAAWDMFRPLAGHVIPLIPSIASAVLTTVEQENERGYAAWGD